MTIFSTFLAIAMITGLALLVTGVCVITLIGLNRLELAVGAANTAEAMAGNRGHST